MAHAAMEDRKILAVFIDFENLALGFKGRTQRFDTARVLARLVEKGDIVVKRAYADWKRFSTYSNELHEAAIELIEIPQRGMTGKNSADMRLCVDAIDLCHSKPHINTFVIVSGDSDFSPLVSKLKENGRHVIGLGMEASTSSLLRDNCHEFIYYEDLVAAAQSAVQTAAPVLEEASERERKLFALLLESLEALRRENRETLWTSLIKETMKRKRPSFNEAFYGYKSFSRLLEDAARRGLVELARDPANRTYVVTKFGAEMGKPAAGTETTKKAAASSGEETDAGVGEAAPAAKTRSRSSLARGSRGSRTRRTTSK